MLRRSVGPRQLRLLQVAWFYKPPGRSMNWKAVFGSPVFSTIDSDVAIDLVVQRHVVNIKYDSFRFKLVRVHEDKAKERSSPVAGEQMH